MSREVVTIGQSKSASPQGLTVANVRAHTGTLFCLSVADEIRPDWEAKLASVKAVAARRANRRIVMRQVRDCFVLLSIAVAQRWRKLTRASRVFPFFLRWVTV